MVKVLLIEDETLFAKSVLRRLEREGYQGKISETIAEGRQLLNASLPDILLLDVRLPDGSGLDLLAEIRATEDEIWKSLPVVVMTAYGELDDAVSAMKLGATDYLKKPVDLDELVLTMSKVMTARHLNQRLNYSQLREQHVLDQIEMIGSSKAVIDVRNQISRIAQLVDKSSDSHPVILIHGQTGTGKDVAARLYHQLGSWHNRPFVHVDCASLPGELIEAELFGHERGAFTNAHHAKAGLIEVAEDGTIFLDEIGELPLDLQAKLLNVLERRVVRRIGSTRETPVSAHFVAATNRNLADMVTQGTFRSDLFYRLNILELILPPLHERIGDIPLLAQHFVEKLARRYGLQTPVLSSVALQRMQQYGWPGNIRELQHVLERAVMLCQSGQIEADDLVLQTLTASIKEAGTSVQFDSLEQMKLEEVEKVLIERSLDRNSGNVSQSARELGLTRMAMRYRINKYGL
ncbi:MAG: sigma-54 dependent transcriptional regulator [Gammaproteobacteria bacterium]|nr:sigma-54 dependent transcriptional regulator [Gammaproteobacteria bacterium]